jgi:hypothetical protein
MFMLANKPLTKASHKVKSGVNVGGGHTGHGYREVSVVGIIHITICHKKWNFLA